MDNLQKTAVVDVQIRNEDAIKRIAEIERQQKALREENKKLSESFDVNAESIAANKAQISILGREANMLTTVIQQNEKANKAAAGSVDQMRAQYSNLKKQYDAMPASIRDNTDEGKALAKQLSDLSNKINEVGKNSGFFKDNIGRYTQAVIELEGGIMRLTKEYERLTAEEKANIQIGGALKAQIADLTEALEKETEQMKAAEKEDIARKTSIAGLRKSYDELKKKYEAMSATERKSKLGKQTLKDLKDLEKQIGKAGKESEGFGAKLGGIFGAIKANPIGLLLTALTALVGLFSSNSRVMDFFSEKFGFVTQLFTAASNVVSRFTPIIKKTFETFASAIENPKKLLEGIVNFIKDQFVKRIESLGKMFDAIRNFNFSDVTGSLKNMANAALQGVTGIENLTDKFQAGLNAAGKFAKEIYNNAQALAALDREEAKINRRRALNEAQNKQLIRDEEALKNIRDDEFKTISRRLGANTRLFALEDARNKTSLADAEALLDVEERRVKETLRQRGVQVENLNNLSKLKKLAEDNVLTEEEINKLGEARQQVYELQEESIGRLNEFLTNQFQLVQEGFQLESEAQQRVLADRIAGLQLELSKVEETTLKEAQLREALAKSNAANELIALELERKQQVEFAKRRGEDVEAVNKLFANRQLEIIRRGEVEADNIYADFQKKLYDRDREKLEEFKKKQQERIDFLNSTYEAAQKSLADSTAKSNAKILTNVENFNTDYIKAQERLKQNEAANLGARIALNQQQQEKIKNSTILFENQKTEELKKLQDEQLQLEQEAADKRIDILQQEAETRKQIENAIFEAATSTVQGLGDLGQVLAANSEQANEVAKAAAGVQLLIDTARSISATIAGASAAAAAGGPAAPFLLVGYIASGIATVVSAFAQAKKMLSFELGGNVSESVAKEGTVGGRRHSEGGTKYYGEDGHVVELEKGENWYVVKRNDSARVAALSRLNVLRGGVPFYALGGQANQAAQSVAVNVPKAFEISDRSLNKIVKRPSIVRVSDINRVNNSATQAKASSTLK